MKKQYFKRTEILATAELFRTCAHPVRLSMIELLKKKPLFVNEIMTYVRLSQAETSHHLGLLLKMGVLKNKRNGKKVFYSVNQEKIENIIRALEIIR